LATSATALLEQGFALLEAGDSLRAGLRVRVAASPLIDGPRFARTFETALRHIWRDYCTSRTA